jgi:hypothetical protein
MKRGILRTGDMKVSGIMMCMGMSSLRPGVATMTTALMFMATWLIAMTRCLIAATTVPITMIATEPVENCTGVELGCLGYLRRTKELETTEEMLSQTS